MRATWPSTRRERASRQGGARPDPSVVRRPRGSATPRSSCPTPTWNWRRRRRPGATWTGSGMRARLYPDARSRRAKGSSGASFRTFAESDNGINCADAPTIGAEAHLPFGGVRRTGNGHREGRWEVYEFYSESTVCALLSPGSGRGHRSTTNDGARRQASIRAPGAPRTDAGRVARSLPFGGTAPMGSGIQ